MKKLFFGLILLSIVSCTFVSCDNNKKQEINLTVNKPNNGMELLGIITDVEGNERETVFLFTKEIGGKVYYGVSNNSKNIPVIARKNSSVGYYSNYRYYALLNGRYIHFNVD
jgi:hypothetical protein